MIVGNFENEIARLTDDYEEKIARLKYEYDTELSRAQSRLPSTDLASIVQSVRDRGQSMRQQAINLAKDEFELSPAEFADFNSILEGYESSKRKVMRLSVAEQKPFFDPRFLSMLREHKKETIDQLGNILNSEQIHALIYDESFQVLGLGPDD